MLKHYAKVNPRETLLKWDRNEIGETLFMEKGVVFYTNGGNRRGYSAVKMLYKLVFQIKELISAQPLERVLVKREETEKHLQQVM